ncbi:MAG: Mbeg1-like protein [Chlamydiales bacterium]
MIRLSGLRGMMNLVQEQSVIGYGSPPPLISARALDRPLTRSSTETTFIANRWLSQSAFHRVSVPPSLPPQQGYHSLLTFSDLWRVHLTQGNLNDGRDEPYFDKGRFLFFSVAALVTSILLGMKREAFADEGEKNRELEKMLQAKKPILNLSKLSLTNSDLEKILEDLSTKQNSFMRVIWGVQENLDQQVMTMIESMVKENRKYFEERPSPYICAKFCKLSYQNEETLKKKGVLPEDWSVLDCSDPELVKRDGYFGAAFVNHKTQQILLAHRGTDALFRDLLTDAIGVVGGIVEEQQKSAIEFTRKVLQLSDELGYRLGLVGHSLGGWFAQLTASLAASKGYEGIYAVTLDTPGAKEMIQTYFKGDQMVSMARVNEERLDFTHFLSLPNVVNCCNTQIGDLFHIIPVLDQGCGERILWFALKSIRRIAPLAIAGEYVLRTHSSEAQLAIFNPESGMPKPLYQVLNWPSIGRMGTSYSRFFKLVRENMHVLPAIDHLSLKDRFFISHVAGYRVIEAQPDEISLSHFSDEVISWLKVLKEKDSHDLEMVENLLHLDPRMLQNLLSFEMTEDRIRVSNPFEFKNTVGLLLKIYPELFSLVRDPTFSLSLDELSLLRTNLRKELIRACETIIPIILNKLYLYTPAGEVEINQHEVEINQHKEEKERLVHQVAKREVLIAKFAPLKENPAASYWIKVAADQRDQLKIMEKISDALIDYKSREFMRAREKAENALALIGAYQLAAQGSGFQPSRLRASLYSLLAKIDRSTWTEERDLQNCEANYLKALDPVIGLPQEASLWSNYGALLNNWGEWLFWEGRVNEALEKHRQAIDAHKKSLELSLFGDWLFIGINQEAIKRDYGRGVYLLAKAKRESNRITEEEFQQNLAEANLFFSSQDESCDPIPVTELFYGIILQDMGRISDASKRYERGLTKASSHPTLLYRKATALLALGDKEGAIVAAKASKEAFTNRGVYTPEDQYRLGLTERLIDTI